jgi:hypothetical protein
MTIKTHVASNGKMVPVFVIRKDMEGTGHGTFCGTVPAFTWRDGENPTKT